MDYRIISRAEWGATPSRDSPELKKWLGWVFHWRDKTKVGSKHGKVLMQAAERYHEQSKGWRDIAYHIGIDRHGNIFQGRDLGRQGAATFGQNRNTMAIVFLFGEGELTAPAIEAARWVIHEHGPTNGFEAKIAGPHSKFRSTQCPGDQIRNALASGVFNIGPSEPEEPSVPAPKTHPDAAKNGPLIRLWLDELDAITYAHRGHPLNEAEVGAWTRDLVKRVYVDGERDLSGTARWLHWKLHTEGG